MYDDATGAALVSLLRDLTERDDYPLAFHIQHKTIVPDEALRIQKCVTSWCDSRSVDLVLTTGGTGFGPRDITPEAIRSLLHKEAPGLAQALLAEGLRHTPFAVLSRPVVGTRLTTLIVTLPGRYSAAISFVFTSAVLKRRKRILLRWSRYFLAFSCLFLRGFAPMKKAMRPTPLLPLP